MERVRELELEAGTLVIADLHLDVEEEGSYAPFVRWLTALDGVPRLIILGDLFEFWIGPAQAKVGGAPRVLAGLAGLVRRGTAVDVVPGNRDFLLDRTFELLSGARVASEALVGTTDAGERVLFLHGDELCTEDRGHQRLRAVLRSPLTRWLAVRLPERVATWAARRLRASSRARRPGKAMETLEFVPETCRAYARAHAAGVVVCGHAHRHRDERLEDGPRWLVLDDFGGGASDALAVEPGGGLALRPSGRPVGSG